MARHRTAEAPLTPHEQRRRVLRRAGQIGRWLALGVVAGFAVLGAMTWAGSPPGLRVWLAAGAGALVAVAAGVASTLPGPGAPDEPSDEP